MTVKHKAMKKKIQYIENNQTRLLSKICKDAGYSKCLCHIWKHFLYFNDPATPDDYGIWFSYGENGWQKTCHTMDPWYDKIYKGLCKCFPNGIEGLEIYKGFESKYLKLATTKDSLPFLNIETINIEC